MRVYVLGKIPKFFFSLDRADILLLRFLKDYFTYLRFFAITDKGENENQLYG